MGQENSRTTNGNGRLGSTAAVWLQFAFLVLSIIAFALRTESRLSKLEQRIDDGVAVRAEMRRDIDRLEERLSNRSP